MIAKLLNFLSGLPCRKLFSVRENMFILPARASYDPAEPPFRMSSLFGWHLQQRIRLSVLFCLYGRHVQLHRIK